MIASSRCPTPGMKSGTKSTEQDRVRDRGAKQNPGWPWRPGIGQDVTVKLDFLPKPQK
jgi:hypothetical protein